LNLEPLADKWKAFGWQVLECDGHDIAQLVRTIGRAHRASASGPVVVLAHTIKGKGVSFMEGKYQWHGRAPNEEERQRALAEIDQSGM
jgi:transketolase